MARRGENIRKRSDERWEGRYIKGRSADGKPCWGYVYGTTYTEVRAISARKKAECGIYNLNSTDITFSEFSDQWLYSVRQGVKESTFSHYQYTLRHYLQPVFGDFKVSALSEKILEQGLLAVITPANGKQKPLGATMAQECLSMLRRICKYAAHFHWFLSGNEEKPVEPRCYRKSIHGYLKKASIHQAHPHALRHTFATTCLQAHCDIKTLSELLGHADATVTLKNMFTRI